MQRLLPLTLLLPLTACAPTQTEAPPPQVAQYQADSAALMSAIALIAPTLPAPSLRTPWQVELSPNQVILRSVSRLGGFAAVSVPPVSILFNAATSGGVTTLTYNALPSEYPQIRQVFEKLDTQFKRLK